ncbi:MAG: orotidine-5'-phosphate decarboxylase [Propionibacteriaceae bacterium]|nr:orotidine-5'-phosphate decarboxylase [Propionibacteriaceae bacterium]
MRPFAERLATLTEARGRLCVGIDPHSATLAGWGLDDTVAGCERFARGLIEALGEQVAAFKPQAAFFEAHGSAGVALLGRVLADISAVGAVSILDVKRGDIGSTMQAYARAYLGDGELAADAVTLSPYLGFGALAPALELAAANGRGVFVLARTSNPEGGGLQQAITAAGVSVAQGIVVAANAANQTAGTPLAGLVIGATHADSGVDLAGFDGWVLAPGIGAQGGTITGLQASFGAVYRRVLPSVSREIAASGPEPTALRDRAAALTLTS